MGKLIKWLFGLIVLLIVLLAAAAVILPMVIDPNDYKPQIVAKAQEQLGREMAIEQDLSLSVFPWLGIETGGVRIGNAEGFKAASFAEIEQLGLKVKLLPLLSRKVEVDTLVLKGLRLNLEKNAQGKTNWDDLGGGDRQADSAPTEAEAKGESAPLALSVQGIQIEDANISWDDRQAGQKYVLDGVRLVTGALAPGATVPVEGSVTFTSSKPAMKLEAEIGAEVSSDADLAVFDVAGLRLVLDASGEGLPAAGAKLTLNTDLRVDTRADSLNLTNLEISGPAMAAKGDIAVTALQTNPAASGKLAIAETNLKTLASMFASPIETTDPAVLTRASGNLGLNYADGALKLDPLVLNLDDSKINGYLHVLDTAGPVVRTRLELDQIDVDRYMPPASSADAGAEAASKGNAKPSTGDPFAALRPLDLIGEFTIGRLKVNNLRMSNVTTKIVSSKGVLKIAPLAANLYEGKFDGNATLDVSGAKPAIAARNSLTGIQVGQLLKDVAGEDRLIGRGELHMDIRAIGLEEQDIRRSLNGTSRFAFRDGAVKGVNIAQVIREGSSRLGLGGDSIETGTAGQTDFSELSGSLNITNGVIKNNDLSAKSPLLRVDGEGEVDLPRDTIDYRVVTELVGSLAGQGGKDRGELKGIPIPVRITGPLTNPKYAPDLEGALSAKAKAQLDAKKEELKQKVEDKVNEKLDGALKGKLDGALKGLFN